MIHMSRTISRKLERAVVKIAQEREINKLLLKYLNRLSDYLYLAALKENIIRISFFILLLPIAQFSRPFYLHLCDRYKCQKLLESYLLLSNPKILVHYQM